MSAEANNPFMTVGNPFMDQPPAPPRLAPPPPPPAPTTDVVETGPTCGDPTCMRAHRPANSPAPGTHYSTDNSTRTRELIEDGKMGGQFGHLSGGRNRRSKRAAEIVADYAVEAAPKIRKAFEDGLDPSNSIGVRQATALHLLNIEKDEHLLQLKEREQEFNQMTKGELVDSIINDLNALKGAGEIADEIVLDATVVEDDADGDDE